MSMSGLIVSGFPKFDWNLTIVILAVSTSTGESAVEPALEMVKDDVKAGRQHSVKKKDK